MNIDNLFQSKEFQNLHPVKQQILKEFYKNGTGTSPEVLLPKLVTINKELSKRNLSFSKEESSFLIQILKEGMSREEQQKVDLLLHLLSQPS